MLPELPNAIPRRTLLKLAVAGGWSLSAFLLTPNRHVTPGAPGDLTASADESLEEAPAAPRYRFDCITPVPAFAPLGRVEEVWASPRYLTITGCRVSYVGVGYFSLTPEETAVVDVVAAEGGDVSEPERTFLRVLEASTRVDPSRLEERLAEFGRPVVAGSLAFAPNAPQAGLFARWLESTG